MYYSGCTWSERRCWNSHFSQFWEIDQIWRGHKIGSFDPVITNSSATDARWPQLYVFSHSDATNPLRKACSERTSLSRPNEHVKTNERTKIYTGSSTRLCINFSPLLKTIAILVRKCLPVPILGLNLSKWHYLTKGDLCRGSDDFKFSTLYMGYCTLYTGYCTY